MMRSVWVMAAAAMLVGCFRTTVGVPDGEVLRDGSVPPGDAARDGYVPADAHDPPPPPPPTSEVDILFVIDNSNSMGQEQAALAAEVLPMVRMLTSGDLDGDGSPDVPPMESLHLGVVSTDMGVGGHTVPTCPRAEFGDNGVLLARGRTDVTGCMATYPRFLMFAPPGDEIAFANDAACVMSLGTGGCGFEQQLEAALKAVSPSAPTGWTASGYTPPTFYRGTRGHGDVANDGFLRDDSILAVVVVTDEEDCSAADPEIYNPASPTYSGTDLSLRCWAHPEALHPLSRYVDGLVAVRPHPSRVVYALVAGVPTDLVTTAEGVTDWDVLVGPPDGTRDERMVERVDPAVPTRLQPSCNVPSRGLAFPPVRMATLGRELEARGVGVTIQSICQEGFSPVVRAITRRIAD